jgi:hypothetical protein
LAAAPWAAFPSIECTLTSNPPIRLLFARTTAPPPRRIPDPGERALRSAKRVARHSAVFDCTLTQLGAVKLTLSFAALGVLCPKVLGRKILIRRSELVTVQASAIQELTEFSHVG